MKSKRKALYSVLLSISLLLCGCNNASTDSSGTGTDSSNTNTESNSTSTESDKTESWKNLNTQNTVVIEDMPTTKKWKSLYYDAVLFSENTHSYMSNIADRFNGSKIDADDVLYNIRPSGPLYGPGVDTEKYKGSDMTADKFPKSLTATYKNENVNINAYSVLSMLEISNPQNVSDVLGEKWDGEFSWQPSFLSDYRTSETVDINSETEKCTLNGESVSIKQAALKSADIINGKLCEILPDGFTVQPISAEVYSFNSTDNECLQVTHQFCLDGIPVEAGDVFGIPELGGIAKKNDGKGVQGSPVTSFMLTKDTIDYFKAAPVNYSDDYIKTSDCTIEIDYEEACEILSNALSDENVFNVKEARLMYALSETSKDDYNAESYDIKPKWRFILTDVPSQKFRQLYVYVNADDGLYSIMQPYG